MSKWYKLSKLNTIIERHYRVIQRERGYGRRKYYEQKAYRLKQKV